MFHQRLISFAVLSATSVCLALTAAPAHAGYEAQAAATKAFALKALATYQAVGKDAAKADFMTTKKWLLGPDQYNLHVAGISDPEEIVWADTGFPEVIGLSFADLADLDGVSLGKSVWQGLAKHPDGVSLQLRFSDPVTKGVAHAEGYCVKPDAQNVICAWSEVN